MTPQFNSAYNRLVAAWKQREELRDAHAEANALIEAKRHLDVARIEMLRVRGF